MGTHRVFQSNYGCWLNLAMGGVEVFTWENTRRWLGLTIIDANGYNDSSGYLIFYGI